jgi:hypothetical protein
MFGDGINIRPHNDVPRRIEIFRNTVIAKGIGIKVMGGDSQYSRRAAANMVFASEPIIGGDKKANKIGSLDDAMTDLVNPFGANGTLDVTPQTTAPIAASFGEFSRLGLPDTNVDFSGKSYDAAVAGAYARPGARSLSIPSQRWLQ